MPCILFLCCETKATWRYLKLCQEIEEKYFQLVIHLQEEESVEEIENPNTNSHILGQFIWGLYERRVYRYMDEWYERNKDYQPRLYEALRLAKEMEEKIWEESNLFEDNIPDF